MTVDGTYRPATAPPSAGRRHSTGVVVGVGIAGLVVGAAAAFAITGLVFTVRVELPPPPYPQLSSVPSASYLPPAPSVAPTSTGFSPLPPPPEPVPPLPPR